LIDSTHRRRKVVKGLGQGGLLVREWQGGVLPVTFDRTDPLDRFWSQFVGGNSQKNPRHADMENASI